MDPLSIATGLVGLLGTAATVINFLDTVKTTIKDAPKTVGWALAEVNDVRSAIARLHNLFEHIESISEDLRAQVTVQDAAVTVSELVTSFDDLVDELKPFGLSNPASMRAWDKAKWARRQDDVAKVIMRIQVRKNSLILILNILQCESDIVAVGSRLALEKGINTAVESNLDIQRRVARMERLFVACIDLNAPAGKLFRYGDTHSDAVSVRSARTTIPQTGKASALPQAQRRSTPAETLGSAQDASRVPVINLEFEEKLAESGVYQRAQRPFDAVSVFSSDGRSITKTIMTIYTLADDVSVLSRYPIIDRSELRHPEFYAAVGPTREGHFFSSLVHRRRRSSDTRGSPQMSVPQQKFRAPPNCESDTMGAWSLSTKRIWRTTEFRFETQFEVPFIFVCRPSNKQGPIKDKPIRFVSGTQESLASTRTLPPREEEELRRSMEADPRHLADERASWLRLLSQLQGMERESREWQRHHYRSGSPMKVPCAEFSNHTLTVAVQAETRSWDDMPASVKKPFATTTFCHLVEIAAMMGIYWKEFDPSKERYHADGNGYTLTGTRIPDLGVMFTFQIYNTNRFLENRVIPAEEVKELCCGFVPTLFQEMKPGRGTELPNKRGFTFLRLGSMNEIAKTMMLMDCDTETTNYFRSMSAKQSHLFPVPFELLGMMGKTLRIRNSAFRMLPNPTPFQWNKNAFNLDDLVREYGRNITDSDLDLLRVPQVYKLAEDTDALVRASAHDISTTTPGYSMPLLNTLHDVLDRCDGFITASDRDLVQLVLREHFQAVLSLINEERRTTNKGRRSSRQRAEHISELNAANAEERQEVFMDLYFGRVFGKVKERAVASYQRRKQAGQSAQSVPARDTRPPNLESDASAIWCTLVLRMMCWLMLHDFDKRDVQLPKGELLGSRIPVYIA